MHTMDLLREKFIEARKKKKMSTSGFEGIMTRFTVSRFESGGDITLSKYCEAMIRMNCEIRFIQR